MSKQILSVQNLSIAFQSKTRTVEAVKNINFNVFEGKTLGIVGESGSGKSVTSMAVMGLLPSTAIFPSGNIVFTDSSARDHELLTLEKSEHKKLRGKELAMIFQEPMSALNPVYTCGNQVMEIIQLHLGLSRKEAKEKTLSLFELVELPRPAKIFNSFPHQISGGQKQRVMIAMAMACQPRLLIADEPTTALDVTVQKGILELMQKLQQEHNTAIIFITHDLGVIGEVADEVLVMYRGNEMEIGPVENIFETPKHPYTKGLLACRPTLTMTKGILPTVSDFMELDPQGNIIEKTFQPKEAVQKTNQIDHPEPILEVRHLGVQYALTKNLLGKTTEWLDAVADVSFEVLEGQTLGLVGESGCGKSTLGKAILGLTPTHQGEIIYRNQNILYASPSKWRKLRTDLQIIFQDPFASLNPKMTVGQIITEPMAVNGILNSKKERKAKAENLLEEVGLSSEYMDRYPHEFSGGQRQRICVARTLALNPKIVICDESVSALDVSVQAQVLNLLNDLKEKFKFTYIFISHDLSVVKFMADQLIVMKEGQIVEKGTAENIYQNPQSDYTKKLIASIPKGVDTQLYG